MPKKSLDLELRLWKDYPLIAGVDEAGRGALAGPIIVASVILPSGYQNSLLIGVHISTIKKGHLAVKRKCLNNQKYNIKAKNID